MVLIWVLWALLELFLYLPLISGAFLAFAQVSGADPMPAAFWWRDLASAIGNLAELSPANLSTFMVAWLALSLLMLVGRPLWTMLRAFVGR
jgi:ABC-type spermidine/putrescine transport system permease subunit II